jgi:hypothetical protein
VVRLHHGHAAGHRLQKIQALRLVIRTWHRQHIDLVKELDLLGALDRSAIHKLVAKACGAKSFSDAPEVRLMFRRQVSRGHQS